MDIITVRIRTNAELIRIKIESESSLHELKIKISEKIKCNPSDVVLSAQRDGSAEYSKEGRSLSSQGFTNGQMVYVQGSAQSAKSMHSPSSGPLKILRGGKVAASMTTTSTSTTKRTLTRDCNHGTRGACRHCCPVGGVGEEEEEVIRCLHGPNTVCPRCMKTESSGEAIEWLCAHPPDQMCINCGGAEKGEKVELEMLCLHGPSGNCLNCMLDDDLVDNRAHISFEEYLSNSRARCEHNFEAKCPNCTPPSEISYKIKPYCTKHKPWPKGLCNECQPPPASLNRQTYRHVDYVEFLNLQAFNTFASLWKDSGMAIQRVGILYGHYKPDPNYPSGVKAVIEAVYEPPQDGRTDDVKLIPDKDAKLVDNIASALGIQRVGLIYTHPKRNHVVSSEELRQMARFQFTHPKSTTIGSQFVSLALSRNEFNEIEPQGYMASDQFVALERDDVFMVSETPELVQVREAKKGEVLPVVIRQDKKAGAVSTKQFEVEFGLVQVNSGMPKVSPGMIPSAPLLKYSDFIVENRERYGEFQNPTEVGNCLRKRNGATSVEQVSDFHLLIYLAKMLDQGTALAIAECVSQNKPLSEGLELMLGALKEGN